MHPDIDIPDKLYFRIGEVARLIGVEAYVLRYWETEFPEIVPVKSRSKQRLYRRQDVELICQIRDLLYKQKYTIEGAKRRLKDEKPHGVHRVPIKKTVVPQTQFYLGDPGTGNKELPVKEIQDIIGEMTDFLEN